MAELPVTVAEPCPDETILARFVNDQLPPDGDAAVAEHVEYCSECRRRMDRLHGNLPDGLQVVLPLEAEDDAPRLDGYQVLGRVAAGGMGVVWRVRDLEFGRDLALKVMKKRLCGVPELERRFLDEAHVCGRLAHPSVVPVHALGRLDDGRPYYQMKLVAGRTLADLLKTRATPAERLAEWVRVFAQVCQAVAYAHSQGVIHRDLKPSNVMVGEFGEVQIIDWGVAKALSGGEPPEAESPGETRQGMGDQTQPGSVLGTWAYMPPEQANGRVSEVDRRSDVFGLGAILCEILTGQPPYVGSTRGEVAGKAKAADLAEAWVRLEGSGADAELVGLCKRCLAAVRDDRPGDALQVAGAVNTHQEEVQRRLRQAEIHRHEAEIKADEERKRREVEQARARVERHRRRWTLVAAGLAVLLLSGAAGGGLWHQHVANERALTDQRDRNRQDNRNRGVEEALAVVEANHGELYRRLRTKPHELFSNPNQGETLLLQAEEGLRRAMLLRDNEPEPLPAELDQLLRDWQVKLQQERASGRANWAFVRRLDKIRQEAVVVVDGKYQPHKAAPEYEKAFADLGFDLRRGDLDRIADIIKQSPIQPALVTALDDWASASSLRGARDQSLVPALLRVARRSDPEPWRDRFRRRESWNQATLEQLALEVDSSRQSPQILAALALRMADQQIDATPFLRRCLGQYPGDFWLHQHLAYNLKDAANQEAHFQAILAIRPDSTVAWTNLGVAYCQQDKLAEAVEACKKALEIDGKHANAWNTLGNAYFKQDKLTEAVEAYKKALDADGKDANAWYNLGNAYARQDKLAEAVEVYKKALEIDSKRADAWNNLGLTYARQDKLAEAVEVYKKALDLDGKHANAWNNLGVAYDRQGKLAEAVEAYKKALEIDGKYANAWYNLGNVYARQDKLAEAVEVYKKALKIDGKHANAWNNLGNAYFKQDKLAEAVGAYKKALDLDGKHGKAWNNLGNAYFKQDKLTEAVGAYKKALEIDGKHASAHANLGQVYQQLGRFAEAAQALQNALRWLPARDPARPAVQQILQYCERLMQLDRLLPKVLNGQAEPATATEGLELARLCQHPSKRLYATAARLAAEAFAAKPKLADDLQQQPRYHAARSAVLAAAGQGEDSRSPPDRLVHSLHRRAIAWLRVDLALYAQLAKRDDPKTKAAVQARLAHWQQDSDFSSVRDKEGLARLPEDERAVWRRLWDDVAALRKSMQGDK